MKLYSYDQGVTADPRSCHSRIALTLIAFAFPEIHILTKNL